MGKQKLPHCSASALFFFSALLTFALAGCSPAYLQNLTAEGPFFQPPVQMVHDTLQTITLRPSVSMITPQTLTGRLSGHTRVDGNGVYEIDTINSTTPYYQEPTGVDVHPFNGNNFSWNMPGVLYGLALDIPVSSGFALSVGGSYASLGGEPYWQTYGMISLFSISSRYIAVRFDAGMEWQNIKYDIEFVRRSTTLFPLVGYEDYSVEFDRFLQTETETNYFTALTLNSTFETSPVNLFLQAAAVRQMLFQNMAGGQGLFSSVYEAQLLFSLTPGFSVRLADKLSVVLGVRFVWDVSTETAPQTMYQPLLQFDMGL
jgi:hypothetical protein